MQIYVLSWPWEYTLFSNMKRFLLASFLSLYPCPRTHVHAKIRCAFALWKGWNWSQMGMVFNHWGSPQAFNHSLNWAVQRKWQRRGKSLQDNAWWLLWAFVCVEFEYWVQTIEFWIRTYKYWKIVFKVIICHKIVVVLD